MNKLSVFSTIVIILGGECFHGINAEDFSIVTKDFTGVWYAVMATGCQDGQDCNIFTNNVKPCHCTSANFIALQENDGWLVYMSSINNETATITIDMGGAAPTTDDTIIQGFIISRATAPSKVITASEYSITEDVYGKEFFFRYRMTIIGSSLEYGYMITTMAQIDENNKDKGNPLTVIWCHNKTPGKDTIWRNIVLHFQFLKLDIHKLEFIDQLKCKYPTENQYYEMFFC
ncbi:hypothetical protein QTP88_013293 [Uroleucon formosanum]